MRPAATLAQTAFAQKKMFQRISEDIACILERDPAAHSAFTPS
jgi:hypothetical protein